MWAFFGTQCISTNDQKIIIVVFFSELGGKRVLDGLLRRGLGIGGMPSPTKICQFWISKWRLLVHSGGNFYSSAVCLRQKSALFGLRKLAAACTVIIITFAVKFSVRRRRRSFDLELHPADDFDYLPVSCYSKLSVVWFSTAGEGVVAHSDPNPQCNSVVMLTK